MLSYQSPINVSWIGRTVLAIVITVKVTKRKSRPFEHAVSMSKRPGASIYVGNIIYYLVHLPDPFYRGLEVDLKGSNTVPILMLSMYIDRLGLFCHL